MINYAELSKTVSHALRHEPEIYDLKIDEEGWIAISELVDALRRKNENCKNLTINDIYLMIESLSKKRHEIREGLIRANYGHSIEVKVDYIASKPPFILYHGTAKIAVSSILSEGLKPSNRLYVHLSTNKETAIEVGKRKSKHPSILKITSILAYAGGISFYNASDEIWLTKYIPPNYIKLYTDK